MRTRGRVDANHPIARLWLRFKCLLSLGHIWRPYRTDMPTICVKCGKREVQK